MRSRDSRRNPVHRNQGVTLIEAVIAVGMLGILVIGGGNMMTTMLKGMTHLELRGQVEDIKNKIRMEMDCKQTVKAAGAACRNKQFYHNQYVSLLNSAGQSVVGKYPYAATTLGDSFRLRAICADKGPVMEFKVQTRRERLGQPLKDTMTGNLSTWEEMFNEVPLSCEVSGGWFSAPKQNCNGFCNSMGMNNQISPDEPWSFFGYNGLLWTGLKGSWCTSGEIIPPSAYQASLAGTLSYGDCYWSCSTGSNMHLGQSVGQRCYGTGWEGDPQKHDNDAGDFTVGCYCGY